MNTYNEYQQGFWIIRMLINFSGSILSMLLCMRIFNLSRRIKIHIFMANYYLHSAAYTLIEGAMCIINLYLNRYSTSCIFHASIIFHAILSQHVYIIVMLCSNIFSKRLNVTKNTYILCGIINIMLYGYTVFTAYVISENMLDASVTYCKFKSVSYLYVVLVIVSLTLLVAHFITYKQYSAIVHITLLYYISWCLTFICSFIELRDTVPPLLDAISLLVGNLHNTFSPIVTLYVNRQLYNATDNRIVPIFHRRSRSRSVAIAYTVNEISIPVDITDPYGNVKHHTFKYRA